MRTAMYLETYDSVWEAIGDAAEETANLKARAQLMHQIGHLVKSKGWKQTEGAVHLLMPPGGPRPARVEVLADFLARHFAAIKKRNS